ncbi:hypothetical protein SD70_00935 [Gordoniibacillus kamchatkensis]|uniref:CopC domain-containing protein n=1 Tax=Gordoniibacillus kamchatkensis TaxID=1590651 RepID=A0ABR5AN90_9BACL|nr:copper resistance protein CopC [Paenibacillus sp. VKM B-2647]KIL42491.1 hypothetical protein SD70_00935 [Paenibacillus sp. VKM B-2647]
MRISRLFVIICLLAMTALPQAAYGHSSIEKTSPSSGEVMNQSPQAIEVWFGDYVDIYKDSITVAGNKKADVLLEPPEFAPGDRQHVMSKLKKPLPSGKYTVTVSVISIDSHPLKSSFQFEVKNPNPSPEERFDNLQLARMSPSDGEIASSSPAELHLWYTEEAKITAFGVFDDKGKGVPLEEPAIDPADSKHHIVKVKETLHPGTYSVHVYAGIGHQEKPDVYYFAVGAYTPIQTGNSIPADHLLSVNKLQALGHWLSYAGLLMLAGIAFFQVVIARGTGDSGRIRKASYLLFATAILGFAVDLWLSRTEHEAVRLSELISFPFFWVPLLQMALLSAGFWLFAGKTRLVLLLLAAAAWAFTGHSVSPVYGGYVGIALGTLHIFAAAIWCGGIAALLLMAPQDEAESWLRRAGASFSKWAFASVIVVAASGVWMTLKYVPAFTLESFCASNWGKMVIVKGVSLLGIAALGYWQRRHLARLAALAARFVRNLRIELLAGWIALAAAAVAVDQSPREAEQGIVPKTVIADGVRASASITPLQTGTNDIRIRFDRGDFTRVRIALSMPPNERKEDTAFSLGNGEYGLTGTVLHSPGTIYMEVTAAKEDGSIAAFPFEIRVPGVERH